MRLRRRFKINFRDIALRGRPVYPKPVSVEKAARRLRALIEKEQKMKRKSKD